MSFKVNGSASKSSTQSTSNTSSTTTPVLPEWISGLAQNVGSRVGDLLSLDPNQLVAGPDPLQERAAEGASGLTGSPWNFDAAADLTRGAADTSWLDPYMAAATPSASAGRASDYVSSYLNPYLKDVVDSSAADLDANAGQVRAQQALDLAGAGAFGGSGAALTQSMTEGELARARASTLSGLRSQAYDTALGAAAGDADRATQASLANAQTALQDRAQRVGFGFQAQQQRLGAANQLAQLSSDFDANRRANIATQAGLGDTFRNIRNQQLQAPITTTQQIVAALGGLPLDLFRGQHTDSTSTEQSKTKGSQIGASAGASYKDGKWGPI